MMKKKLFIIMILLVWAGFALGQGKEASVCCEKTSSGLFCQNVPEKECLLNARQLPTSCESTSYCKLGYCYDSNEGTCIDHTPQLVCNAEGGIWSEERPEQCNLGCCILGDQAAFVTLVRCKKLSSFLGLKSNYNKGIKNEVECVLTAGAQEKGACIYDFEFERTCKFTTRADCSSGIGENDAKGEFYPGKLCSAEELATNCGPSEQTTCVPGKDEVYFMDSCGNPANIYDASKIKDKEYWGEVKSKLESCGVNAGDGNANSVSCGNCNYLMGGYCRSSDSAGKRAKYGDNICADLNCKNTQNGKSYKHGESWCVFDDKGSTGKGKNSVGSRFYKHICVNGEEVLEQCTDFRQYECIEDKIETPLGEFSQAGCVVNRWQDCTLQKDKKDCENTDKRDCLWKEGKFKDGQLLFFEGAPENGACIPKNPPGLKFWEGEDAKKVCGQANTQAVVTLKKGILEGSWKCDGGNCFLWDDERDDVSKKWEEERKNICMSLGDCGPSVNWIGVEGYKESYNISVKKFKKEDLKTPEKSGS